MQQPLPPLPAPTACRPAFRTSSATSSPSASATTASTRSCRCTWCSSCSFGEAQATTWQSLFKSGAYSVPDARRDRLRRASGQVQDRSSSFSLAYMHGLRGAGRSSDSQTGMAVGLFLIAFGTGGIKPCVSTNVGDQFTATNQHLIERAFSWFYLSINAGSLGSHLAVSLAAATPPARAGPSACPASRWPWPRWCSGLGRKQFAVVPPAGKQWLARGVQRQGAKLVGRLGVIYLFIAVFFSLLRTVHRRHLDAAGASPALMDKHLGFGVTMLPAQIQFFNPLFILAAGAACCRTASIRRSARFFAVTPLRKIGIGFFVAAEFIRGHRLDRRPHPERHRHQRAGGRSWPTPSSPSARCWCRSPRWSTATSRRPLRMKSFIMALYLLSLSAGNLITALVAINAIKPVEGRCCHCRLNRPLLRAAGAAEAICAGPEDRLRRGYGHHRAACRRQDGAARRHVHRRRDARDGRAPLLDASRSQTGDGKRPVQRRKRKSQPTGWSARSSSCSSAISRSVPA